jgi:hypothetical protein
MKKLGLAALLLLPFLGGCYAYAPRPYYSGRYYHRHYWGPRPVVVAPVPPPPVYW